MLKLGERLKAQVNAGKAPRVIEPRRHYGNFDTKSYCTELLGVNGFGDYEVKTTALPYDIFGAELSLYYCNGEKIMTLGRVTNAELALINWIEQKLARKHQPFVSGTREFMRAVQIPVVMTFLDIVTRHASVDALINVGLRYSDIAALVGFSERRGWIRTTGETTQLTQKGYEFALRQKAEVFETTIKGE